MGVLQRSSYTVHFSDFYGWVCSLSYKNVLDVLMWGHGKIILFPQKIILRKLKT